MGSNGIDGYTKLMLHCNGIDGSAIFTDSGLIPKIVTAYGNAQIDTARSKFGGASGLFDGSGDYLSIPGSSDFEFGSGNFTVDFWWYPNATPRQYFFGPGTTTATHIGLGLDYSSIGTNKLGLYASSNGTSWDLIDADPGGNGICVTTVPQGQQNHIALVRNGNNWRVYLNGIVDLDIVVPGTLYDRSGVIYNIGRSAYTNGAFYNNGWIDEYRVSKGIARWTANFTPPTKEYEKPILAIPFAQII